MEKAVYKKQVALLLSVLPEVAKEECFARHGDQSFRAEYAASFG